MKNSQSDSLEKARAYAFLLLKFRLRSEAELCLRLKQKKFSPEVIQRTIAFLKEKAFLDDRLFAKNWIDTRLKRPLGLNRVKEELSIKGVSEEIIEQEASRIGADYCEKDIVERIVRERLARLKGVEPARAKNRVYAYLLRRGFSPDMVIETVNNLCKPTS